MSTPLAHTDDFLSPAVTQLREDLALAALVLASGAEGPCAIENHGELRDRYPRLLPTMRALGLTVDVAT